MADFPPFLESLPEGVGNPEQGVEAEKGESPEQERGHAPECIIKVRIFIPVMMGGMRQITGEFAV